MARPQFGELASASLSVVLRLSEVAFGRELWALMPFWASWSTIARQLAVVVMDWAPARWPAFPSRLVADVDFVENAIQPAADVDFVENATEPAAVSPYAVFGLLAVAPSPESRHMTVEQRAGLHWNSISMEN